MQSEIRCGDRPALSIDDLAHQLSPVLAVGLGRADTNREPPFFGDRLNWHRRLDRRRSPFHIGQSEPPVPALERGDVLQSIGLKPRGCLDGQSASTSHGDDEPSPVGWKRQTSQPMVVFAGPKVA